MESLKFAVFFLSLLYCVLADEVCYPPCGCFSDDPPFNGTGRPLPESPEEQQIEWLLYTRSNRLLGVVIPLDGPDVPPEFNPNNPTKFLIHGWFSSPGVEVRASMVDIKNIWLDKEDVNVITVDWTRGASKPIYAPAVSNTRVVGACSGVIASRLHGAALSMVHCVGHSLGSHCCGAMGYHLGGQLGRATGLDPAGPGFELDADEVRLDRTDANFVDTINTNSEGNINLGLGLPVGHADFYPNKGGRQPGCNDNSCDHGICTDYFAASLEFDSCNFWSNPCNSFDDADAGLCETCTPGVDCQKMGFYADAEPGRGTFYLRTVATYPHCEN